jgi:secreted PhoX family phosphatase
VNIGANSMLAADPVTREVKRFLTSPKNCEVTGVTSTPDGKTFFVGIQHPGEDWSGSFTAKSTWPDSGRNGPTSLNSTGALATPTKPRAATLVITHNGGAKIGAGGAV